MTALAACATHADGKGEAPPLARPAGTWATVLTVGALLALPLAVFLVLRVEPYFLQNGVDPSIYFGYAKNLPDLVERFGYPYFAVRFGLILPSRLFISLFGTVGGFFVLRYVLALLCAAVLYLFGRRNQSPAAGWFGAIVCLSSPVFLRALMTNYSDTTGLPCTLAGVVCLLMPSRRNWLWAFGAGLLFGAAIHSNPFSALVLVAALGARALTQVARREYRQLLNLVVAVGGVVLVTLGGIVYYKLAFESGNVLSPSFDAAGRLAGDAKDTFRSPDAHWLQFSPHLYLPLLATVLLAGLLLTRPAETPGLRSRFTSPVTDSLVMLLAVQGFYLVEEFLRQGYALETYYYSSYLFAFVVIGLTAAMADVDRRLPHGTTIVWVAAALVVVLPLARDVLFSGLEIWVVPAVPLLVLVLIGLLIASTWSPPFLDSAVIFTAGAVVLLALAPPREVPLAEGQRFRQDPHYELATGNPDTTGLEWLQLSSEFIDAMPSVSEDAGSIIFWYPDSYLLDIVQSTYLWRSTTLQAFEPTFPNLSEEQRAMLADRTPRHLVVLAESAADLEAADAALDAAGVQPLAVGDEELVAGGSRLLLRRYTLEPDSCDTSWPRDAFPIPWRQLPPCP